LELKNFVIIIAIIEHASFDPELLKWVDEQVEKYYHFKDRSNFIEILIGEYREKIGEVHREP